MSTPVHSSHIHAGSVCVCGDLTLYPVESTAFTRQGSLVQIQPREPDQTDVDRMFADFVPMQLECLRNCTTLLPHVAEMTQAFQKEDIKIGSSE